MVDCTCVECNKTFDTDPPKGFRGREDFICGDCKILQLREKIAKTDIVCGECGETIKMIDLEQHVKDRHFD